MSRSIRDSDRRYARRPEVKQYRQNWWFKSQHGITIEQRDELGKKQNGACAICGAQPPKVSYRWLHVDHSHATGKVRGLLCEACNKAISLLKDSPELCNLAARYLRQHESEPS